MLNKFKFTLFITILSLGFSVCAKADKVLDIKQWQTKNGAKIYYVYAPQLPMVDVKVAFQAGSARDGNKFGVAALTNNMLEEGSAFQSADQIAENFDKVGAVFDTDVARDMAVVSMRSLSNTKELKPALDNFHDVLVNPSFPEGAFKRVQSNTLVALAKQEQSPSTIASKAFYKALYGHHPYAHAVMGNKQSVETLTSENLRNFYKKYYVSKNAVIAIVGDITKQQAVNIANNLTKGLIKGNKAKRLPIDPTLHKSITESVNYPSSQTQIRMGQLGVVRNDPDYFPLYVGNYILGGGSLVSRLYNEVREKHGLSYSVYSYFIPMEDKGPFVISLGTRNAQAKKALKLTQQTLNDFVKTGPTKEELEAAKKNIIGGFPMRLDSNKAIADYILMIGFYNLPKNYLDTFRNKIEAVSLKNIKAAFKKRIHPDKMVLINVGKIEN